jgi:hypothetical protein
MVDVIAEGKPLVLFYTQTGFLAMGSEKKISKRFKNKFQK